MRLEIRPSIVNLITMARDSETVYNPRSGQISSLDPLGTIDREKNQERERKFASEVTRLTLFL